MCSKFIFETMDKDIVKIIGTELTLLDRRNFYKEVKAYFEGWFEPYIAHLDRGEKFLINVTERVFDKMLIRYSDIESVDRFVMTYFGKSNPDHEKLIADAFRADDGNWFNDVLGILKNYDVHLDADMYRPNNVLLNMEELRLLRQAVMTLGQLNSQIMNTKKPKARCARFGDELTRLGACKYLVDHGHMYYKENGTIDFCGFYANNLKGLYDKVREEFNTWMG